MNTAADRFRRLMVLLPRFAESSEQSLPALSRELDIPRDTIITDLESLVDRFDDPPGYLDSVGVLIEGDTVTVRTDHFLRPMRVSLAELCALELGLMVLERESEPGRAATVAALRTKLDQCITRMPNDRVYRGLRGGALTDGTERTALERIRRALRQHKVITFGYQRPDDPAPEPRTARPYALLFSHGAWYLAAHCETNDGMRLFRTDRMDEVTLLDRVHAIPDGFSVDDVMHDGRPFVSASPPPRLVIRYSPAIARWIAERDGKPLEADGSAVRSMPLADREWAIRHVLQYGPDAQVVEPKELREEVVERLRGMTR